MRYVVLSLLMMFGLTPTAYGQLNKVCLFYNLGPISDNLNLYYAYRYTGATCNEFEFITQESNGYSFPGYCEMPDNCVSCISLGSSTTGTADSPTLINRYRIEPDLDKSDSIVGIIRKADEEAGKGITIIGSPRIYSIPDKSGSGYHYVVLVRQEVPMVIGLGKTAYRDVIVGFEYSPTDSTEIAKAVPYQGTIRKVSVGRPDGTRFVKRCLEFDFVTGKAIVSVKDSDGNWPITP